MFKLLLLQFNLYVFHDLKHQMKVVVLLDFKAFNPTNIEIFVLSHHLWLIIDYHIEHKIFVTTHWTFNESHVGNVFFLPFGLNSFVSTPKKTPKLNLK